MFRINYLVYFLLLFLISGICSCKNQNRNQDPAASVTDTNPAYKTLNDSILQFPKNVELYMRRALRLTRDNAHELAYTDFKTAYELLPDLETALPFSANLEILGRNEERLNLLKSLNVANPSDNRIQRLLAEAYSVSGKPAEALSLYNKMLSEDSSNSETLYEKALLLEQIKDTAGAITALQKAYSFQGVDTYGLELAHLYAEQNNSRSLEICNYIISRDSARLLIDPLFIKGIYFANVKQYAKAIQQFDLCILRDWKTTDAYLEKGRAYFHMGNYIAASQTFKLAITVSNTDPDAYFWLGRCYEAQNLKQDALSNYQRALSLDKNFTEANERIEKLKS